MLHTIQADFYRLFRSKGFWITEAILVLNILSGVIFGATGHVGVNTESKLPQATEVWTGFKALTNYSSSISVTILFTIIVITLVLGTDLTQNLYKNSLAYGVSRTSYYFAKAPLFWPLLSSNFLFLMVSSSWSRRSTMDLAPCQSTSLLILDWPCWFSSFPPWLGSASFPSFFMPANPSPWPSLATSLEISS